MRSEELELELGGDNSSLSQLCRVTVAAGGVMCNVTTIIISVVTPRSGGFHQIISQILNTNDSCVLTIGHVEAHGVAGGVGRGAGVVAGVLPQGGADGQGADRGVGGRHPQLVPPRPLCPAHLARHHGDALEEVDHGVVVIPAAQGAW